MRGEEEKEEEEMETGKEKEEKEKREEKDEKKSPAEKNLLQTIYSQLFLLFTFHRTFELSDKDFLVFKWLFLIIGRCVETQFEGEGGGGGGKNKENKILRGPKTKKRG